MLLGKPSIVFLTLDCRLDVEMLMIVFFFRALLECLLSPLIISKNSHNPDSEEVKVKINVQAAALLEMRGWGSLVRTCCSLGRIFFVVIYTVHDTFHTVPCKHCWSRDNIHCTSAWLNVNALLKQFFPNCRVSSPSECVLPIAKWEPKDPPRTLEDVGPLVEHIYEVQNHLPFFVVNV